MAKIGKLLLAVKHIHTTVPFYNNVKNILIFLVGKMFIPDNFFSAHFFKETPI